MKEASARMPVLFVGHGDPRLVLGGNRFFDAWARIGADLPVPKAILCISAHWETDGVEVTAMERPRTIHDFGGFPEAMYEITYPAPGAPVLARDVQRQTKAFGTELDFDWGLDHGTWCILKPMWPEAGIPVFQLSLSRNLEPRRHYELGRELRSLRDRGVLIVGSGNVVHNLGHAFSVMRDGSEVAAPDWAVEFDTFVRDKVLDGDHQALWDYEAKGAVARQAAPTPEHYLPLLYALGARDDGDEVRFHCEDLEYGAISMRTMVLASN